MSKGTGRLVSDADIKDLEKRLNVIITPKNIKLFFYKVNITESCWEWKAYKDLDGYGKYVVNGVGTQAHRFSYILMKGKIDSGLVIDHLCRNRSCVNPDHLELVTNNENIKRGLTGKMNNKQKSKTHCPQGHEYSIDNTYSLNGNRYCKKCHRINCSKYRIKKINERIKNICLNDKSHVKEMSKNEN